MKDLLELLQLQKEFETLIEQEIDNLTVKEFVQLHEQGILHEGKLSTIIGLGGKAKDAVKKFGVDLLGDKKNQAESRKIIERMKTNLNLRFDKGESKKVIKMNNQLNKLDKKIRDMPWVNDPIDPHIIRREKEALDHIKNSKNIDAKMRYTKNRSDERFTKKTEAAYTNLRNIHDTELAKLMKSQKSVNAARTSAGTAATGVGGLGILAGVNKYKESKKTKLEKLKDKLGLD